MKTSLTLLIGAIALVSLLGTGSSLAIPTQVGGFNQVAGMRLEDFLKRAQTWKQDAELKGKWEMWNDPEVTDRSVELLKLSLSAVVFGVTASEVTVQRRDGKAVLFNVVFQPSSPGETAKLKRALRTNAAAWAGGKKEDDSIQAGATTIAWKSGNDGSVTAIFTPRSAATPS